MDKQAQIQRLVTLLAEAGEVFDANDYRVMHGLPAATDALAHYVSEGAAKGLAPNFLFLAEYYRQVAGLSTTDSLTPLEHFLSEGLERGLSPHPLFDRDFYLSQYPDAARSSLPAYLYFLRTGKHRGDNPSPLFDTSWYVATYPYVTRECHVPIRHYLVSGHKADCKPSPLFDTRWYKSIYGPPAITGLDPLSEFVWQGQSNLRMPNALFDTYFYLNQYPDVLARGRNALSDYVTEGWAAGRFPNPLFDSGYYLQRHQDVKSANVNPLAHYIYYGAGERRDPSPLFSSAFYLSQIPNSHTVTNPLEHYIWGGCVKGYYPSAGFAIRSTENPQPESFHSNPLVSLVFERVQALQNQPAGINVNIDGTADFVFSRLGEPSGIWSDNWCQSTVSLSYILSEPAVFSAKLWTVVEGQSVRVLINDQEVTQIVLPAAEQVELKQGLDQVGEAVSIKLLFATSQSLSSSDPRQGAAVITDITLTRHAATGSAQIPAPAVPASSASAPSIALLPSLGDVVWAARLARTKGIKKGINAFVDMQRLRREGFNESYYMSQEPFRFGRALSPVRHYVLFGAQEQLDPSPEFSTEYYILANPDVRTAGVNPYAHYLAHGRSENRRSEPSNLKKN